MKVHKFKIWMVLFLLLIGFCLHGQTTSYSCTDMTSITLDFAVPLGKGIHIVELSIDTNTPQSPAFSISGPAGISGSMTLGTLYDTDSGDDNNGIRFIVSEPVSGSGNYLLKITEKPAAFPGGTFTGSGTDIWSLTVASLSAGSDPAGEITSWDNSFTPAQLFENGGTPEYDIAHLTANPCPAANTPPTAMFTIIPSTGTEPVTISFEGAASFDPDTGDSVEQYHWDFDGDDITDETTTAPTTSTSFDYNDHGVYTAKLIVTDTNSANSSPHAEQFSIFPDQEIVFPAHINVAGSNYRQPPVIDGYVIEDTGWNQAMRITHEGGAEPEMAFQGLKDRSAAASDGFLYMSFQNRNDTLMHEDTVVVLAFSPDNDTATPADDRILAVYPFSAAHSPGAVLDPDHIRIWDGAAWNDLSPAQAAAMNMEIKIRSDISDGWNMELKVPVNITSGGANWVNFDDAFLFYYNVIRVLTTTPDLTAVQYSYPRNAMPVSGDVELYPFAREWWSHADKTTGAVCNGVWVDKYDIGIQPNPGDPIGSTIALPSAATPTVANRFVARLQNTTEKEIIAAPYFERIPADGVSVQFKIANWGIPALGDWADVQSTPNPTTPVSIPGGIPAGAPGETTVDSTWSINNTDPEVPEYTAHSHQCVQAIIDSSSDAKILRTSVYRNMDFEEASELKRTAEISARGYGNPYYGRDTHKFLITVARRSWESKKDPDSRYSTEGIRTKGTTSESGDETDSYLTWSAYGYRYNGEIVIINGNIYSMTDSVGSFGYNIHHDGPVVQWISEIQGEEVEQINENSYILEIEPETVAQILTRIRPRTVKGFSVSLHGGSAVPLPGASSTFASDYNTGYCGIIDFGYKLTPGTSLVAMAGYNYFPAASAGVDDMSLLNISLNGKYAIPFRPRIDLCAGAGLELFLVDFDDLEYGYNALLAWDYKMNRRLTLELGVIYHSHFNQDVWFMQAHGGIIFNF